jgi:hypothetical protein
VNTCKTCQFWKDSEFLDVRGKPMNSHSGMKQCTHPKLSAEWATAEEAHDMLMYDYSEGGGQNTGPDFGCIHHTSS